MAKLLCAAVFASTVSALTSEELLSGLKKISQDASIQAPVVKAEPAGLRQPGLKSYSTILMHGLGDAGSNPGMNSLAVSVSAKWNTSAFAVDVADGLLSFITPIQDQVDEFAAAVKKLAVAGSITTNGIHGWCSFLLLSRSLRGEGFSILLVCSIPYDIQLLQSWACPRAALLCAHTPSNMRGRPPIILLLST